MTKKIISTCINDLWKSLKEEEGNIDPEILTKLKNNHCPYCDFDYKKLPPQIGLISCPKCQKSYADISEHFIRILF